MLSSWNLMTRTSADADQGERRPLPQFTCKSESAVAPPDWSDPDVTTSDDAVVSSDARPGSYREGSLALCSLIG